MTEAEYYELTFMAFDTIDSNFSLLLSILLICSQY